MPSSWEESLQGFEGGQKWERDSIDLGWPGKAILNQKPKSQMQFLCSSTDTRDNGKSAEMRKKHGSAAADVASSALGK